MEHLHYKTIFVIENLVSTHILYQWIDKKLL